MEDRVACQDLDPRNAAGLKRRFGRAGFFAVFDGHVGQEASNYLAKSLPSRVRTALGRLASSSPTHATSEIGGVDDEAVSEALRACFIATDADLCATMKSDAGSTCAAVLVLGDRIFVANLGDSRVVLCRGGQVGGSCACTPRRRRLFLMYLILLLLRHHHYHLLHHIMHPLLLFYPLFR